MSLQFIIGSSGSGKTYTLYKELIRMSTEDDRFNYIALVPEQATLQTQKDIVNMHPRHGTMAIDILSFERLAYRVFEELGCTPALVLDDIGKNMLLRKAFDRVGGSLSVYRKNLKKAGFIDEVKSLFSELYQYRVGTDDIGKMVSETENRPLINRKLKDILLLRQAFDECMGNDMIAAEETLEILAKVMERSDIIKNSIITLDGFTGFTPVQYEVIRQMMKIARKVVVTITVDERENPYDVAGNHTLFYLSRKTIDRLDNIAAEEGVKRDEDIRITGTPYRFKNSSALAFLEKELFRYPFKTSENHGGISVHSVLNPQEEVSYLTREIFRLVRDEKVRYREIGVIAADTDTYEPFIKQYFGKSNIPYFMDSKKSIMSNPLVEFIRAAVEVLQKNFEYESVFRYLKSGFFAEHNKAIFEMENYVLATGLRGCKAWEREWTRTYSGGEYLNLEWINTEKDELIGPVISLKEELSGELTVEKAVRALYGWLEGQEADIMLEKMAADFEADGKFALAREYSRAYTMVLDLLDRLIGLVPDEPVTLTEFSEVLDAGFEKIKVGMIPPCIDRIMVGDMTRSRLKDIKHLFFIGMNDCYLPAAGTGGGLFSDIDREILSELGMELSPGEKEKGFIERLYVYLALTKPSESLTITYSKSSMSGKGLRPSSYIKSVLKLFNNMETEDEDEDGDVYKKMISKDAAKEQLIEGLRDYNRVSESGFWKEIYNWFYRDRRNREMLKELVDNAFLRYTPESIGHEVAEVLYGREITGSVTRLEKYAACAYAQFLSYGLNLKERREYEFAAVDLGNMFHASIENYFKYIRMNKIDMYGLSDEKREEIVKECVLKAYENSDSNVLESSARNRFMIKRIERIVDKTVWVLGEQLGRSDFKPVGFEVPFGNGNDAMNITVGSGDEMRLKGKVDRIDICENDDSIYVKIVDYKSGNTEFDYSKVYNGLQIQLIVYLDAVMRHEKLISPDKDVRIAGVFYYNIDDPVIDSDGKEITAGMARELALGKLKPNGLVNSDMNIIRLLDRDIEGDSSVIPVSVKDDNVDKRKSSVADDSQFKMLTDYIQNSMSEYAKGIFSGNINISPYKMGEKTGCDFCSFKTVCGFDSKIPGYSFRKIPAISENDFWNRLCKKNNSTEGADTFGSELD